ncbi:MAG: hypothetical protein KDK89_04860 [Alphaproteobacteria bacterium]|nr:hypothetical protein [Alphaproteobacteria bacterium]
MKRYAFLTAVLLTVMAAPASAGCSGEEATLFSCATTDDIHTIMVCGIRDSAADGFQSIRYVYGTDETEELSFPENRRDGRDALHFSHHYTSAGYNWSLRFDNGNYRYRVFFVSQPEDDDPDTIVGPDAGVEVWRRKKKIATVMCGERPYALPDDIRRATSCDADTPVGEAGCAETPPERK